VACACGFLFAHPTVSRIRFRFLIFCFSVNVDEPLDPGRTESPALELHGASLQPSSLGKSWRFFSISATNRQLLPPDVSHYGWPALTNLFGLQAWPVFSLLALFASICPGTQAVGRSSFVSRYFSPSKVFSHRGLLCASGPPLLRPVHLLTLESGYLCSLDFTASTDLLRVIGACL